MQRALRTFIMLVLGNLAALNLFGSTPPYAQPAIVSSAILANTTGIKFTLSVESDQAATIYYVVGTTNTNPSAAQVRAGNLGGGAPAPISGSYAAAASPATSNTIISGLTAGTTYYVNFIIENAGSEQSGVGMQTATATNTAPSYNSAAIINVAATTFDYQVNLNEDADVYYVVTTSNTAPTVAQVLAGKDNTGATAFLHGNFAATTGTNATENITGLTQNTTYYVYSVAQDPASNNSAVNSKNATTTTAADNTAPTYNSSSTLNATETTFDYKVNLSEAATVYYVVTTSATPPTAAQIKTGKDNTGATALKSGNFPATGGLDAPVTVTGLTSNTAYHIYSVAVDAATNTSTVDHKTATTISDITAPTYTSSGISNIASTNFDYTVKVSEDATIFYVVTTSNTAPTVTQVEAGNDNTGSPAFISGSFAATGGTDTPESISGLSAGTTYYVYSIAKDPSGNKSTVRSNNATTLCAPVNVTAASVTDDDATTAALSWTNAACFDEVLVVARQTNPVTATPSGNGGAYTANAAFGSGTAVSANQYAVYKGTGTSVTITGLTDGDVYNFMIFTRKGTSWSSGVALATAAGSPRVVSFNPADGATNVSTDQVFTITFNENVFISSSPGATSPVERIIFDKSGSGDLNVIRDNSGDGTIVIAGNVATVTLNTDLDLNTAYDILIGNRVFRDAFINYYGGTSSGNWNITTTAVGTTVTAPTTGVCDGQYNNLGNITLTEGNDNNFQGTDNGTFTFILSFDKTGFIFYPGTTGVSASIDPAGDIQSVTVTSVTFSQATFSVKFKDVSNDNEAKDDHDFITISGLKVTTDGSNAPPAKVVVNASTSLNIQGVTGGSTTLANITAGSPSAPPTSVSWSTGSGSYCAGTNLSTIDVTPAGGTLYNWYSDAALTNLITAGAGLQKADVLFGATPAIGAHTVYVTSASGCESTARAVTLTMTANPIAEAGNPVSVCSDELVTLGGNPTATGGSGSYTYAWSDGGSYSATASNPSFNAGPNNGTANINTVYTLTVKDVNNCTATDNVTITIKGSTESVLITEPNTFFYTSSNSPVNLKGSPAGGVFSGVGVVQYNGSYTFDPEVAGIGTWPVKYTATLANGCTKSITKNFDVSAPFEVFAGLEDQYCNNEAQVQLTLAPAMVTQIQNYITTWNTQYTVLYGYSPLKTTFRGIVRSQYAAAAPNGYGDNGGVVKSPTNATYVSGGATLDRYIFKPQAFATDAAYPGCATCGYAYIAVYLEFASPLLTYPYNIPNNSDQGYTFNDGTTAAFTYTSQYVAVNPVPQVFFTGLKSGLVGGDTNFCNADVDYNLTGNKVGGLFEISSNNTTFDDVLNDGILNTTAGNAQFNPKDAYGSSTNTVTRYVRYSVNPGTTGSATQGCIGRQTQIVQVHPATPISFAASVDAANTEYCYEGAGRNIVTNQTSNVTFSGYGIADDGASKAVFTPQVAFDQKDPAATTAQTVTVSAVYTNNIGCQTTITRDYKVFPKPQSTFTLSQGGSPTTSVNFCYGTPTVTLSGNQPTGSTQKYTVDYISSLGYVENVASNTLNFNPKTYYDQAVTHGNSNVGDAQFNISYIVTDQIGCTASTSKILTVSPLAEIIISGINPGASFCSNSTPFGITFAPAGGSLSIDGVTSTNKLDANNTLSSINIPIGTNIAIQYDYASGLSKCPNSKVYNVSNIAAPDAKFSTVPTCDRDEVTFSALNDPNSFKWTWVLGDSVRSGTDAQTIKHVFPGLLGATQTSYTIKLISENDPSAPLVCRDSAEAVQVIGAYPKTDFNYANLCHDDFTKFTITSDIPIATAEWDFGDTYALSNNPLNTPVPAGTHGGRTTGKFGQPEHQFSFTTGVANRYLTRLISRTAAAVGACRDTVIRQVAILEKLAPTPAQPYLMADYENIEGLWLEEDRGDSSTWIFDLPTGKNMITNSVGKVWITNAAGTYKAKDNSYVNSPCFDLSAFTKPVFALQYWNNTDLNKDGAVLQYSVDGGATWSVLGNTSSGLEWFNEQAISSAPGGQNQLGWSGRSQTGWKTGKNSLDGLNVSNVRFRIAFASDERDEYDGFAFNNARIDERNRIMLIEHFTNVVAEASNNNIQSKINFNTAPELSTETVRLQYHTSFPGPDPINTTAPADHNARTAYYGLASENIPAGLIDGAHNAIVSDLSFKTSWYKDVTNKRSLNASPFRLTVETLPAGADGVSVHVKAERIDDLTSTKPVLHIALVEKTVGDNLFVLRKMLPSAAGTAMKANPNDEIPLTFEVTYSWLVNYFSDLQNLAVVAFIQDETTREVFQASILANPDPSTIPSVITGVEPSFASQVSFYPNPANHTLNVVLPERSQGDIAVTVIDAFGREVVATGFAKGDKGGTIDTGTLAAGVYVVQLQTTKGTLRRKIIVAHD